MENTELEILKQELFNVINEEKGSIVSYHFPKNIVGISGKSADEYMESRRIIKDCEKLLDFIESLKCEGGVEQILDKRITEKINKEILDAKKTGWSTKDISDEWHTFEDLYEQRMYLFLTVQLANRDKSWKSKLHDDGTMFEDSFIVGIETPEGQYTYHYDLKYWELFKDIRELDHAPRFDGHTSDDVHRLLSLYE